VNAAVVQVESGETGARRRPLRQRRSSRRFDLAAFQRELIDGMRAMLGNERDFQLLGKTGRRDFEVSRPLLSF
jgi:hypothetical protein